MHCGFIVRRRAVISYAIRGALSQINIAMHTYSCVSFSRVKVRQSEYAGQRDIITTKIRGQFNIKIMYIIAHHIGLGPGFQIRTYINAQSNKTPTF